MNDSVVALFCGAGGLSLGFKNAGIAPKFAADHNSQACETYSRNQATEAHQIDIGSEEPTKLLDHLKPFRDCFAVVGGPPCQGFSTAGARRHDDVRNRLVFNYLNIVDYVRPRWFLFENVEGILTSGDGSSISLLLSCFIDRGYTIRIEKVNFAAYGLPQSRKRVIVIGNRLGIPFSLPPETHSYISGKHNSMKALPAGPSLNDAIGDLPECVVAEQSLAYKESVAVGYAHKMRQGNRSNAVMHHFQSTASHLYEMLQPGQTMKDLPEDYWHPSFKKRANRRVMDGTPTERRGGAPSGIKRLYADRASLTITSAANREFIHPTESRPLTLREAARLQSFPDWFNFNGNASAIALQIGNAIPPLVGEVFARHLLDTDGAFGGAAKTLKSIKPGLLGFRLTDASGQSPALKRAEKRLLKLPMTGLPKQNTLWQEELEITG